MTERANTDKDPPVYADPRREVKHQDTVMLSDVPDAAVLLAERALDAVSAPPATTPSSLNLSSVVLAALGQRYEILAEAGHGSMGNVYKARDRETGETVALKLLKPEIASDQAMMDRFKNELLFARKITHKNVCRVYEFNRAAGVAYTSMEFVEGESLRSVLNRFGGLPLRKSIDLSLQICSGLKEAHAQGIVHRDLKPENVMIDSQGNVKIMDFGIARSMEAVTRLTGTMVGTPAYMAPEQVSGKPVDYRTDIYSLGLMLYEMFTGAPAFVADNPIAIAMKQMRDTPPPPHEVEPAIPVDIERSILKCLEKDPARRFQSIAELDKALRSSTASRSVVGTAGGRPVTQSTHGSASPVAPSQQPLHVSIPLKPAKRTPIFVWPLLAMLLAATILSGLHAMAVVKSAQKIPAPVLPKAPEPPEIAMDKSVPEKEPDVVPQPATEEVSPPVPAAKTARTAHAAAKAAPPPPEVFPAVELPGRKAWSASKGGGGQQAAKNETVKGGEAANEALYVWVGRYPREEKAQEAAKKLEQHSLSVVVIPRHSATGEAFAVFTGPYSEKKITGVVDWLRTQGFPLAHAVANPLKTQGASQ
jgi:serine/threonine protein kinase